MNLAEKLRTCLKYIKENGYPKASIVRGDAMSEMIIFNVPNITAKYPNEKPSVSVAFANGTMNGGEIDFDILQVLCFISNGVPKDRLSDIQKFCADFNKTMQIGYFGVDFKNESVYFKSAQVVDKNISPEMLARMFDNVFTMILFYFGYAYEILIELSYGVIGYGGTSRKLVERKRLINEAMAEINSEQGYPPPKPQDERSAMVDELLRQLRAENPEILEKANIDVDEVRRRAGKNSQRHVSAEETAQKILNLAADEKDRKKRMSQTQSVPKIMTAEETSYPKEYQPGVKQQPQPAAPAAKPQTSPAGYSDIPEPPSPSARSKRTREIRDLLDDGKSVKTGPRTTVADDESVSFRNPMPSIDMYTQKDRRRPEPPLDMAELERALKIEQEERDRALRMGVTPAEPEPKPEPETQKKSSDSLVQRLRNWTQNS